MTFGAFTGREAELYRPLVTGYSRTTTPPATAFKTHRLQINSCLQINSEGNFYGNASFGLTFKMKP